MNDYLNVIRHNYANFQGRARRREYWMFSLINGVIVTLLSLPLYGFALKAALQADSESLPTTALTGTTLVFSGLIVIYSLAVLVPSLAVTTRRLHDTGKSGWLYLLTLVPFVGSLIVLVFTVLDSEPGANRWGPNPKGETGATPVQNW